MSLKLITSALPRSISRILSNTTVTQLRPAYFHSTSALRQHRDDDFASLFDTPNSQSQFRRSQPAFQGDDEDDGFHSKPKQSKTVTLKGKKASLKVRVNAPADPTKLTPDNFDISPRLMDTIRGKFKIKEFFPIQAEAYGPVLEGVDIIARSRTGTGKTLAFALPIVERLLRKNMRAPPGKALTVIMEPTRELCQQVADEFIKLDPSIRVAAVYGKVSYTVQERAFRQGVDVLVATPGRLKDHLEKGAIDLSDVMTMVLDEADEMLKMGFQDEIEAIFNATSSDRQTLLFSATVPTWVLQVGSKYMEPNPLMIDKVGGDLDSLNTPEGIKHQAMCVSGSVDEKAAAIRYLLDTYCEGRAIIFSKTKMEAANLANHPALRDVAAVLHGDIDQNQRLRIVQRFKSGGIKCLTSTDLLSRGHDIPSVDLVVSTFFPDNPEHYVHRAGRTGRAGRAGTSVILHSPSERSMFQRLGKDINTSFEHIHLPNKASLDEGKVMGEVTQAIKRAPKFPMLLPVAEKLHEQYGVEALYALLAQKFKSQGLVRSILAASPTHSTVLIESGHRMYNDQAQTLLEDLLGRPLHNLGRFENFDQGAALDLSIEDATELATILAEHETPSSYSRRNPRVTIPDKLPQSFYNTCSSDDASHMEYGHLSFEDRKKPSFGSHQRPRIGHGHYDRGGHRDEPRSNFSARFDRGGDRRSSGNFGRDRYDNFNRDRRDNNRRHSDDSFEHLFNKEF